MTRDEITREDITRVARSWLGTKWAHGQMTKGAGADCLGFIAGVALELGYADARRAARDERFRAYGRMADPAMLDDACKTYLDRIPAAVGVGDVLQMTPAKGIYAQHFAIVSAFDGVPTRIIHCTNAYPRQVTEHGIDAEWRSRVKRVYAWRGVE